MYNLYIEEKKKAQERLKLANEVKMNQLRQRHKKIQPALISNYDMRVKDFILEMAISKDAVKHKDCQKPILNTRLKYLEENRGKIKGRSGFLYRGYKSEKERIKDAIEYNKVLFSSIPFDSPKRPSKRLNQSSFDMEEGNRTYCQPQMKFRARNDLERIREGVNLNYYGKVESEIIRNQLLAIKNKAKKRYNSLNSSLEEKKKHDENEHIIQSNKKSAPKNYTSVVPRAVLFRDDNKYKTHFKATESIILREGKLLDSTFYHKKSSSFNHLKDDDSSNQRVFDFEDKNLTSYQQKLRNTRSQDTVFILNRNPIKKREIFPENTADLSLLRQIAFTQREKEDLPKIKQQQQQYQEDMIRFEKKITIDKEEFGIQSQINLIAEKVLNKCNIYSKKNKANANSTFHESKTGKLMMTSGLSIKDFLTKYNLPG